MRVETDLHKMLIMSNITVWHGMCIKMVQGRSIEMRSLDRLEMTAVNYEDISCVISSEVEKSLY